MVLSIRMAQDEEEGTRLAKRLLSYFQGCIEIGIAADQEVLRESLP
ncbi:MAG: hypothetical protein P8J18_01420 [Halieaceae bacterium]|nr:hypothetical protein [Halieaceae bacterium]